MAVPDGDSGALPRVLPLTTNVTKPVGVPAPGGTAATVATRLAAVTVKRVLVAALPTTMSSSPVAGAIWLVPE